ncbi:MAG: glutaredoxin family protein [Burkholderiales bacterium]|nr:glutaredoxin family protein [Burkholderiales bacterium]
MNANRFLLASCLLTCVATLYSPFASAQLYKWVGPDGKITYSDTPPPKTAAKVEKKNLSTGPADAGLPYEVSNAMRNHPVTLYSADKCAPCDAARQLLQTRGVPYTEKTVSSYEEQTKLQKISGGIDLPYLKVGSTERKGFESDSWNAALTTAGYPESNILPRGYQFRSPEPLIAVKPKAAEPPPEKKPEEPAIARPKPVDDNAPPGFQF